MIKTSEEIKADFRAMLRDSELAKQISGEVYPEGSRPRDSVKEDAVVILTAALSDEIQSGVVTVHVYVPDKDYGRGYLEKHWERVAEIESLARDWVESLTAAKSCYRIRLQQAICSQKCEDIEQHFTAVCLSYNYYD